MGQDELVFYSKGTFDIEYKFPFTAPGFGELKVSPTARITI